MGGIFPGRTTIGGSVGAPGIPLIASPTSGLFQTPSANGMGVSFNTLDYLDMQAAGFNFGYKPAAPFGVANVAGSPYTVGTSQATQSVMSPDGRFVFVNVSLAGVTNGVVIYNRNVSTGVLTLNANSPFSIVGSAAAPYSIIVSPDGLHLYVQASTAVWALAINGSTGALTSIASYATGAPAGFRTLSISSDGLFVYAAAATGIVAYSRNIGTGALSPIVGSPFLAGNTPYTAYITDDQAHVIAANYLGANVSVFSRNAVTGALSAVAGSPFNCGSHPCSADSTPDGTCVVVSNFNDSTVTVFNRVAATGALTPAAGSPVATGLQPIDLSFSIDGLHLAVTNDGAGTMSVFTRTPATNALAAFVGSPFTLGGLNCFGVNFSADGLSLHACSTAGGVTYLYDFITTGAPTYNLVNMTFDPLGGLGGAVFVNGSLNVTGNFTVNGGVPATFPAVAGNGGKALYTNGVTEIWDTITNVVPTAFVANAATATFGDSGTYIFDLTGVLTGAATLTLAATYAGVPSLVGFDNTTTGAFAITTNLGNVIPSGMSIWYWDGAALGRLAQNLVFASANVAMVANAAAITIPANGFYTYDVTGVLTGTGNITPTVNGVLTDVSITFDNQTTGGFLLQFGGFLVPPGRSIWYFNGTNFELTNQNPNYIQTVPMVANAATMTLYETANNIVEVTGVLTANGQITTTFPTNATQVVFDNGTTGAFLLQLNAGAYTIPPGKSVWYWNGATLELINGGTFLTAAVTPLPNTNTQVNQTHNFGALIKRVSVQLVCLVAEFNYAIGDVVDNPWASTVGFVYNPMPIVHSATNLGFYMSNTTAFSITNKTTGAAVLPTLANWSYRFVVEI